MIGFAADGAAVMTGRNRSVAQLLKNENNDLFIIKCVCHNLALCSSYACLKLPSSVETLARNGQNILDYNEVYLGVYARKELMASGLEETQKHKIIHNCINFYVELCDQILIRFDLGEKFQALSLINPYYIISNEKKTHFMIFVTDNSTLWNRIRKLGIVDFKNSECGDLDVEELANVFFGQFQAGQYRKP
ncbi:hypothetical protein FF38_01758 [Lucilia cuprina]|uniref:DUF4371 domain-containing protein n=1 Tax=Lucilia cuprina TaxID=7375 RepID=A0A0L0BV57_LUCCU|nr:hypothetical protein FF38_01758 [Lucilia cuprina]